MAGFIVLWALAMKDEGKDAYTISEYQRYYNENERKAYRDQAEFRDLWSEFETPNELARQIVPHLRGKLDATKLPSSVGGDGTDGQSDPDASSSGLRAVALEASDRSVLRVLDSVGRATGAGGDAVANDRRSSAIQGQRVRGVASGKGSGVIIKRGKGYGVSVYDPALKRKRWVGTFKTLGEAREAERAASRRRGVGRLTCGEFASCGSRTTPAPPEPRAGHTATASLRSSTSSVTSVSRSSIG